MTVPRQPAVVPPPRKPKSKPGKSHTGDNSQDRPERDGKYIGIAKQASDGVFDRVQAFGYEVVGTQSPGDDGADGHVQECRMSIAFQRACIQA